MGCVDIDMDVPLVAFLVDAVSLGRVHRAVLENGSLTRGGPRRARTVLEPPSGGLLWSRPVSHDRQPTEGKHGMTPLRALTVTAAAGLLCATATTGAAYAATATPPPTPVGTWSAKVILDGDPTTEDHATISFTASGKVCLATSISAGDGVWWPRGGAGFGWTDKEVFVSRPNFPGYVLILQRATLASADAFTSSGRSQVFDQQGNWEKSVTADLTATRTSDTPDPSCS